MICKVCRGDKLSSEFFLQPLTDDCKHGPSRCLQCLLKDLHHPDKRGGSGQPACPDCSAAVPQISLQAAEDLHARLLGLCLWHKHPVATSPAEGPSTCANATDDARGDAGPMRVVLLDGTEVFVEYLPERTVDGVLRELEEKTGVSPQKLRLLFKGQELKALTDSNRLATLADCNLSAGSSLYLMILLYEMAAGGKINDVTFHLSWIFPGQSADYLDGSCLAYSGDEYLDFVDYSRGANQDLVISGVTHSGDVMHANGGQHIISVDLPRVPARVTRLYFTLSAWICGSITAFRNQTVKMFDRSAPDAELCSYSIQGGHRSQAVIMCCLARAGNGWRVCAIGRPSRGNAENYMPIVETIRALPRL